MSERKRECEKRENGDEAMRKRNRCSLSTTRKEENELEPLCVKRFLLHGDDHRITNEEERRTKEYKNRGEGGGRAENSETRILFILNPFHEEDSSILFPTLFNLIGRRLECCANGEK